ncbi:unnamed protein product [Closterium sp. NIES-54]
MQEVTGVGEVLLEGTNGMHVTLHDVLFMPRMKGNLVSLGQLMGKGANLQIEGGAIHIIASRGQVAAIACYHHRLLCLDLNPWPASNGTKIAMACNGSAVAATCNGTTAATARRLRGHTTAQRLQRHGCGDIQWHRGCGGTQRHGGYSGTQRYGSFNDKQQHD